MCVRAVLSKDNEFPWFENRFSFCILHSEHAAMCLYRKRHGFVVVRLCLEVRFDNWPFPVFTLGGPFHNDGVAACMCLIRNDLKFPHKILAVSRFCSCCVILSKSPSRLHLARKWCRNGVPPVHGMEHHRSSAPYGARCISRSAMSTFLWSVMSWTSVLRRIVALGATRAICLLIWLLLLQQYSIIAGSCTPDLMLARCTGSTFASGPRRPTSGILSPFRINVRCSGVAICENFECANRISDHRLPTNWRLQCVRRPSVSMILFRML